MSLSEKMAIAAHLHVLLRRKTGRVTDTEWMATNPAYAQEVIRLAREKSAEGDHDELGVLADRLEHAMSWADRPVPRPLAQRVSEAAKEHNARVLAVGAAAALESGGDSAFGESQMGPDGTPRQDAARYIKGLR